MFFRAGSELEGVSGKRFPHPALLFVVRSSVLHVRALFATQRPRPDSKLAAAPYWNIDSNGAVCAGTMRVPKSLTVTSIAAWQQAFFQSEFTHPGGGGRLTKRRGGTAALWKSLAGKERFPHSTLVEQEPLDQYLKKTGGREMMTHTLDPQLLERPIRILVVGCGGNGSAIVSGLPYLHQAMLAFGHPGGLQVTLIDPDTVSETNCVRQPFCRTEIGFPKAIVLAHRINLFWGLNWQGMQATIQQLQEGTDVDFVIGCVDTRKGAACHRQMGLELAGTVLARPWQQRLQRTVRSRAAQELCEQRKGKCRLPTVAELYPEIAQARQERRRPAVLQRG